MDKPVFRPGADDFDLVNAYFLARVSRLAYDDKMTARADLRKWGFRRFRFLDNKQSHTQAFVTGNKDAVIVAFRGTEGKFADWVTDIRALQVGGPFLSEVHEGFADALGSVWLEIKRATEDYQDKGQGLWFTGHSLGGGLATLAAAKLLEQAIPVRGLYTFGAPRVGDTRFADTMNAKFKRSYRFVNNNDLVTRLPRRLMGFRHVEQVCYFNSEGELEFGTGAWERFLDRVQTKLEGLLDKGPKIIEDHDLENRYIPLLETQLAKV